METAGICHGMGIMYSDVLDTVFHSSDAGDSMCRQFSVQNELDIVLC